MILTREQHLDRTRVPKRILSLDGGGIRGVLTLEYLGLIEPAVEQGIRSLQSLMDDCGGYSPYRDAKAPQPLAPGPVHPHVHALVTRGGWTSGQWGLGSSTRMGASVTYEQRLIHRAHRITLKEPTMRDPGTRRGKANS